ncbi:VOC family protein [Leucobacter allii]|uniref:VOC family protein n=1 Tax=Leucobacter allii TaxID=2932247 RepID=UPI001FD3601C|nr:VOC family protein [Leucobacter allii]UOR00767.1 VOC family protein [Leucobacter allii]
MALPRMDHVSVVVRDLEEAIAFFAELGLTLDGRAAITDSAAAAVTGIPGMRTEIAMMRTPDGHGALELTRYDAPEPIAPAPGPETPQALGLRTVMFEVADIDDAVRRLRRLGGELVDRVVPYGGAYRLCYLRGPDGILVALAERIDGEAGTEQDAPDEDATVGDTAES